jgi:hypothetical protein
VRQNFRNLSTTLTGEVWFSFLARTTQATSTAGLSFNPATASPYNNPGTAFVEIVGTSLIYRFGDAVNQTLTGQVALNTTSLLVGQMILNGSGGEDLIKLWLNPDLSSGAGIFDYTPVFSSTALHYADSVSLLGAIMHNSGGSGTNGGQLDAIRLSDGNGVQATAIADVTGVPEPSAAVLLGFGAALLGASRRRPRVG